MNIKQIGIDELKTIAQDYISYFNESEGSQWTEALVHRKFKQLIGLYDFLGIGLYHDDQLIGFSVGNLVQFDDGIVAKLNELFIIKEYQSKGYGTYLLREFEKMSKKKGAFRIQLESANDETHHRFYNERNNYQDASNNILKSKLL